MTNLIDEILADSKYASKEKCWWIKPALNNEGELCQYTDSKINAAKGLLLDEMVIMLEKACDEINEAWSYGGSTAKDDAKAYRPLLQKAKQLQEQEGQTNDNSNS